MNKRYVPSSQYSNTAHDGDESYAHNAENAFLTAKDNPLSTFSIDVDAASYSNVRRFINNGQLPPQDAVRVERHFFPLQTMARERTMKM